MLEFLKFDYITLEVQFIIQHYHYSTLLTAPLFLSRVNKDTKEPDVDLDEILIQSIPDSLNKITALLHQKDLSMFVADTVVDTRDAMEFNPGSENEVLECLEGTLTEEELLFLEEETKLAKMELQNLRYELWNSGLYFYFSFSFLPLTKVSAETNVNFYFLLQC